MPVVQTRALTRTYRPGEGQVARRTADPALPFAVSAVRRLGLMRSETHRFFACGRAPSRPADRRKSLSTLHLFP